MALLLYWLAAGLVRFLQALPLRWVARIGRAGGGLAYHLDARHRRVAIENLTRCFGTEKSPLEIQSLARENFKRLGECYLCGIKTASMPWPKLSAHLEFGGLENVRESVLAPETAKRSCVMAIGHFGNFELYARANHLFPEHRFATTYRALKQPRLNQLLVHLRSLSGCLLFERRQDSEALRTAMSSQRLVLGLLADQHAGRSGAWIPFFGHPCSTTIAPAILASRYKASVYPAICYRTSLAKWKIEIGDEIATECNGERRSSEEIMLDVNRAFEMAIRRDPANWFWVHKRWKPRESKAQRVMLKTQESAPAASDPL